MSKELFVKAEEVARELGISKPFAWVRFSDHRPAFSAAPCPYNALIAAGVGDTDEALALRTEGEAHILRAAAGQLLLGLVGHRDQAVLLRRPGQRNGLAAV